MATNVLKNALLMVGVDRIKIDRIIRNHSSVWFKALNMPVNKAVDFLENFNEKKPD